MKYLHIFKFVKYYLKTTIKLWIYDTDPKRIASMIERARDVKVCDYSTYLHAFTKACFDHIYDISWIKYRGNTACIIQEFQSILSKSEQYLDPKAIPELKYVKGCLDSYKI